MEITEEILKETLQKIARETEFKSFGFTLNKDLLSLNDSGINNPNYIEAIPDNDVPWNVNVHIKDEKLTKISTIEVDVRNSMNEFEFEKFIREKLLRVIQENK